MSDIYLQHHGVKGMKWGVRRKQKTQAREKQALIDDSKKVTAKAPFGKHMMVTGKYHQKMNGKAYVSHHIVDEFGKVKMSYINGKYGDLYIATGKKYIDENINLKDYFRRTKNLNIEYDVYD